MQMELDKEYGPGAVNWNDLRLQTNNMLSELFRAAGRAIGQWPNSAAYYSVDVIYDVNRENTNEGIGSGAESHHDMLNIQPKLIEVNFMGDWHGVENAVGSHHELYWEWAGDLVRTLVFPAEEVPSERVLLL